MKYCKICRKSIQDNFLCSECEDKFNQDLESCIGFKIDYKIGDTLYTIKTTNIDRKRGYIIVPVIYKGPKSYSIEQWYRLGKDYLRNYKNKRRKYLVCTEVGKNSIIYRHPTDLYKTYEECEKENRELFANIITESKKSFIINLFSQKLDEILIKEDSSKLDDESFILEYLINPTLDEMTFKENQYKQIRTRIKSEIINNEISEIRKEIENEVREDIIKKYEKSCNKFLKEDIREISKSYHYQIQIKFNEFMNSLYK